MRASDLIEAIDTERCKKYSGYERQICMWVYNEVKPTWGPEDIQKVRQKYGGVNVGTVYRGAKINDEDTYQKYKNIEPGDTVDFGLVSATPDWPEALSFAQYVKSYDEMTMLRMLKNAYATGSAGIYGVAILTLNPNPENVVVKTYTSGGEKEDNENWKQPQSGAEAEILLTGSVPVEDIEVIDPITPENYQEVLDGWVKSADRLQNEFFQKWIEDAIEAKRIDKEEFQNWAHNKINKLISAGESPVDIIQKNSLLPFDALLNNSYIQDFLEDHLIISGKKISIEAEGQEIRIPLEYKKELLRNVDLEDVYKNTLKSLGQPKFEEVKAGMIGMRGGFFDQAWYKEHSKELKTLFEIKHIQPEAAEKHANHKFWKAVNQHIAKILHHTEINLKDADEKTVHKTVQRLPEVFKEATRFLDIHPESGKVARSMFKKAYEWLPHGSYDRNIISDYGRALNEIGNYLGRWM